MTKWKGFPSIGQTTGKNWIFNKLKEIEEREILFFLYFTVYAIKKMSNIKYIFYFTIFENIIELFDSNCSNWVNLGLYDYRITP